MTGVFANRKTIVTLDEYGPSVVQPWIAVQRRADQMARSRESVQDEVIYRPGVGWRIRAYQMDGGEAQERTAAAAGYLTPSAGSLTAAADHVEYNSFRQKSELDGVTYGTGVSVSGAPRIQKRIPSGSSWEKRLTSDQTTFPGPFPGEDSVSLDRVALSTSDHEPWDDVTFTIDAGGDPGPRSTLATFYFCGPAGSDLAARSNPDLMGLGQYALKLRGDGKARLYEKLAGLTWKKRFEFVWKESNVPYRGLTITIVSDCYDNGADEFQGRRIAFLVTPAGQEFRIIEGLAAMGVGAINIENGNVPIYDAPRLTAQPTALTKIRVDIARDLRASFAVQKHIYPDEGVLLDDNLGLDAPVVADTNLFVYWQGIVPPGCSLQLEALYNGAPLTATTTVNPAPGIYYRSFVPVAGMRTVQIRATFESDSTGERSPSLQSYAVYKSPVYQMDSPIEPVEVPARSPGRTLPRTLVSNLSLSDGGSDPNADGGSVGIVDLTGELTTLKTGQMRPVKIETVYNALGDRAVLFRGYAISADADVKRRLPLSSNPRRGTRVRDYPVRDWREYSVSLVGEWARLAEAYVQRRLVWLDPLTGSPMKVTDIVRILLGTVYPSGMIDVPDLPIRLFSTEGDSYVMEPGTRVGDACRTLIDDYLGGYLLFDPAAGSLGMWRLLMPKGAPYTNLCAFDCEMPTDKTRLPHYSPAYGTMTYGGNTFQKTFIQAGTLRERVEKAEGNIVLVMGAAVGGDASAAGTQGAGTLSQVAVNVNSYNFLNLSTSHPYYPDGTDPSYYGRIVPIRVFDYKLGTQDAVDWVCRRVFDRSCFARRYVSFTAPMVLVTDPGDALQTSPRRLRYYDPVLYQEADGSYTQFLVVSCNPSYRKDHVQMAEYTLVTQANINTIGVMPRPHTPFSAFEAAARRHSGDTALGAGRFSQNRAAAPTVGEIMGLPELPSAPIQDLNPSSPGFGSFYTMVGY